MGLEDYVYKGNNRIFLPISIHAPKKGLFIDAIENGIVIDHIEAGRGIDVLVKLGLSYSQKYSSILGRNVESKKGSKKDIIKEINGDFQITDQMVNNVVAISPNVTFNLIREGQVVEKYKAIICSKSECQFYPQDFHLEETGELKCHCGREYKFNPKLIEIYKYN